MEAGACSHHWSALGPPCLHPAPHRPPAPQPPAARLCVRWRPLPRVCPTTWPLWGWASRPAHCQARPRPSGERRGVWGRVGPCVVVELCDGAGPTPMPPRAQPTGSTAVPTGRWCVVGLFMKLWSWPAHKNMTRTPPTHTSACSLAADEIEIGLGIHGEPGRAAVRPPPPAADLVTRMVAQVGCGREGGRRAGGGREWGRGALSGNAGVCAAFLPLI